MKRFRDLKIGAKLMVVFLGIGVSLAVMAGYFLIYFSSQYLVNDIKERYMRKASNAMYTIDILINERYYDIKAFAKNEILTRGTSSPQEITEFLKILKETYGYESLSYFDMNRVRIADTEGLNLGQRHHMVRYWEDVLKGEVSAGNDVRMAEDLNIPIVYFASQVINNEGNPIGVVVARYNLEKMDAVTERLAGIKINATLIDREKNIIFTNCPELKDKVLKEKILELDSVKAVLDGQDGAMLLYDPYCKKEFITAYSHEKGYGDFKGNDWSLLLSIEKDKALTPIARLRNIIIMTLIGIIITTIIVFYLVTPVISSPITRLKEIAQRIGRGDLTVRASVSSKDEIGQLAESFNKMTEDLKSSRDGILKEKAYTDGIISSLIDTLIVVTLGGHIQDVNQATLDLLGYKKDELIGKPVGMILAEEEEEEILFKDKKLKKLIQDGQVRNFEMTYKTKTGEKIPVSFSGAVMYETDTDKHGLKEARIDTDKEDAQRTTHDARRIFGIVGIARDMRQTLALISDLNKSKSEIVEFSKTLEKKVEERTKDLDEAQEASLNMMEDLQASKENLEKSNTDLQKAKVKIEEFSKGLEGKVKERTFELAILYEISNAISYTLDYQTLLRLIMESLFKVVKYDTCASLLFDERTANIMLKPAYPQAAGFVEEVKNALIDSTSTLTGENIRQRHLSAILIPSTMDVTPKEEREFKELRSFFNVPFIVRGKTIGMINVSSCKENAFNENDVRLIYTIANQASGAIARLQEVITAEKTKMDSMVESMAEGVIMIDERDEVVVINPKAKELLGFAMDEGVNGTSLKSRLKILNLDGAFVECKNTNMLAQREIVVPQEKSLIIRCRVVPVKDFKGEVIGMVAVLRDITKEKEIDQMKTEFISIVSHELRTPLAIIKEGIGVVLEGLTGEINEKQSKYLGVAGGNVDRLTRLIDGLLDISKLEAGKMEVKKNLVDIVGLINEVAAGFAVKVKSKGLEFKFNLPDKPIGVFVDRDKITQVLVNLIGNSLKFTDKGYIEVSAKEKGGEAECVVADTGKGIGREDIPHVFEKFMQFGRTYGPGDKGTGLGLSISKGIIEKHGGTMRVESELNSGSRFIFTLPKFTDELAFINCISEGMQKALNDNSKMSVISITPADLGKAVRKFPGEKFQSFMREVSDVVKKSLRRQGDVVIKGSEEAVILIDCDKENALRVLGRLEQMIDGYLEQKGLGEDIKLKFTYATYPDDGKTVDEIMKKIA